MMCKRFQDRISGGFAKFRLWCAADETPMINAGMVFCDRHYGGINYPLGGVGRIPEALAEGLRERGSFLVYKANVSSLTIMLSKLLSFRFILVYHMISCFPLPVTRVSHCSHLPVCPNVSNSPNTRSKLRARRPKAWSLYFKIIVDLAQIGNTSRLFPSISDAQIL